MTIAAATEAQVYTAYASCNELVKILQEYVQGSANGAAGTLSRYTVAQVNTLVADTTTALQAITAAA